MPPPRSLLLLLSLADGCASAPGSICSESSAPAAATGLSGVIDGTTPVVEVVRVLPVTCEERERTWMFWDDDAGVVTLGAEPSSGTLRRDGVDVEDRTIYFSDFNVGVRLDYPDDQVGPSLSLAWFSVGGDLATVDCDATETLVCATRE